MAHTGELQIILQQLIDEHEKLLRALESQQAAMKRLDARAMDELGRAQESSRLRIATLEARRRQVTGQLAALKLGPQPTVSMLADALPAEKSKLLALRNRLKELMAQVASRSHVAGRLAGAVLGHLNTMVCVLAGAVEQAGVYTKHGVPQVSGRIGVMEAVG